MEDRCLLSIATIGANTDSFVSSLIPNQNFNAVTELKASDTERSFVQFNLGSIPSGVIIDSASLNLRAKTTAGGTVSVYASLNSWGEKTITSNNQPATTSYSAASQTITSTGWKSFDVRNLVQEWYSGSRTNYGLALKGTSSSVTFVSREDTAYYPRLVVEYHTAVDNPPQASLTLSPVTITTPGVTAPIQVRYTDDYGVNVSTIDPNDILVTGPNGYSQNATLSLVDNPNPGSPREATYTVAPPGGRWDNADNGSYTVTLRSNQVYDNAGHPVASKTLGTFTCNIPVDNPPQASLTLSPGTITTPGATAPIQVRYTDDYSVDVSTIDSNDILVTGPNGYSQNATLSLVDNPNPGSPREATYTVAPPGGRWDSADNGSYTITLRSNQVYDNAGHPVASKTLGTFNVNITPPPQGLTIITHGYLWSGTIADWVTDMATEIIDRAGGGKLINLNFDSGTASVVNGGGAASSLASAGETVVVLDWASKSNNTTVSFDPEAEPGWREAAGDLLANYLLGSGLAFSAVAAGAPIHFIGHSFGAVVISEAIQRLGVYGVDVDQMTTLDPHDQDQDWVPDATDDPQVTFWSNVTFADNYWQDNVGSSSDPNDGSIFWPDLPVGHPVTAAYNRDLTEETYPPNAIFGYAPHSRVHEWYYETIDGNEEPGGLGKDANGAAWYPNGDATSYGFAYSSIGGLRRPSVGTTTAITATPSIFNGDFLFHDYSGSSVELPGYSNVPDLGDPFDDGNFAGRLSLVNDVFETQLNYIPTNASVLVFQLYMPDDGFFGSDDTLQIYFNDQPLGSPILYSENTSFQTFSAPISKDYCGKAGSFKFDVNGNGVLGSTWWIDNIRIAGTHNATLTLVSNDPDEPDCQICLSGMGEPIPTAEILVDEYNQTVVIGDASSSTISVTANGDTTSDPDETPYVNLNGPTNATLSKTHGVGTILNDDVQSLSISQETIGLFALTDSWFFLRNDNSGGHADLAFGYGPAGADWTGLSGDWNGDGADTIGLYNPVASTFYLRDTNDSGSANTVFGFGPAGAGWKPIVGDWDGDGVDTIGLYNPATSTFFLKNSNAGGGADVVFDYGPANGALTPIAGDWNGDHKDTVGLYSPTDSVFLLCNTNGSGYADMAFGYGPGNAGWKPIVGDWNGDDQQTIGLYTPASSTFFLRNSNDGGGADVLFDYGPAGAGWTPVVGDWNGLPSGLRATDGNVAAATDAIPLTQSSLNPIIDDAIARWAAAGLPASSVSMLKNVDVVVADLPGSYLGLAEGNTIRIDRDAAGHGWFVDPTPASDEEFASSSNSSTLRTVDARAVDRIDLLTVVEHELGHIAGLDDLGASADNLMTGVLATGTRRNAS